MAARLPARLRGLRPPRVLSRALRHRRAPLVALVLVLTLSTTSRVIDINQPCTSPCSIPSQYTLIFDEAFYVNAARAIARVAQPGNSPYAKSPLGKDPNAEHPQLAKMAIAAGIEALGDNAWGWRIGSILFGLIALVALYALVRAAGGSSWLGVGAATVMSLDNLALVHSRIATLDIYAVAMMLVAAVLYIRRRPLLAGAALGVAICMKEVSFYLLPALVLYEAGLYAQTRWGPTPEQTGGDGASAPVDEASPVLVSLPGQLRSLALCIACTAVVFFGLLWVLDIAVPAWDPGSHTTYARSPFPHFSHMVKFAESLKTGPSKGGISSTPLQWLLDKKPIDYAKTVVTVSKSVHGFRISQQATTTYDFRGEINPFIIFLVVPALALSLWAAWRRRDSVALVGASWAVGTFAPYFVQSEILNRTSYLFYMLIVMPGIYLMTARLFSPRYVPKLAAIIWGGLLIYGFVRLYPIRTLL